MANIKNPILRGFNPDPSICRAGDGLTAALRIHITISLQPIPSMARGATQSTSIRRVSIPRCSTTKMDANGL